MPNFSRLWQSRPFQITLAAIGVVSIIVSTIVLVRLFNPSAENPISDYDGVFTGSTTNAEGEEVAGEIDTSSFPEEYLSAVSDIVYADNGDAYFTNQNTNQVFLLRDGTASVFAGTGESGWRDGSVDQAKFTGPSALDLDTSGNLYVVDKGNHRIRVIDISEETVVTLAGGGEIGYGPGALRDGDRAEALFNQPDGIAIAPNGNVYVADTENHSIRLVTAEGVITVAGNGEAGFRDGASQISQLSSPEGLDFLDKNTLVIADKRNGRIRTLDINTNELTTLAGNGRTSIADGPATQASFHNPTDIEVANNGSIFITDRLNHVIRVIALDDRVYTLAGTGSAGYQDGPLSQAQFNNPTAITESTSGALLVVDEGNQTIRQLR
jgi:sugar lactone lactonase YvrE